jgi:hypothetical protein
VDPITAFALCKGAYEGGQQDIRGGKPPFHHRRHPVRALKLQNQCDRRNKQSIVHKRGQCLRSHDGVKASIQDSFPKN